VNTRFLCRFYFSSSLLSLVSCLQLLANALYSLLFTLTIDTTHIPHTPAQTHSIEMEITRAVFRIHPRPKTQTAVWQLYNFVHQQLHKPEHRGIQLVSFTVPRTTYFGRAQHMDQLQLSLRRDTNTDTAEEHTATRFLDAVAAAAPEAVGCSLERHSPKELKQGQKKRPARSNA
jgi:hypothetical protein